MHNTVNNSNNNVSYNIISNTFCFQIFRLTV